MRAQLNNNTGITPHRDEVKSLDDTINNLNKIADKQGNTLKFTQSVNSYFGSMVNLSSYNVRKRLFSIIDKEWFRHIYFVGYKKVQTKKIII